MDRLLAKLRTLTNKQYYLFNRGALFRRIFNIVPPKLQEVTLPWGLSISVYTVEYIGSCIAHTGIYELNVTEALWRLIEPGESVIDAGAHIGYMTSLMASRVGAHGTVYSFEPHPDNFRKLEQHIAQWSLKPGVGKIIAHQAGLGDCPGKGTLLIPSNFEYHGGAPKVVSELVREDRWTEDWTRAEILVETIDEIVGANNIGVMKIDVEGNESLVLKGAHNLLSRRLIRDLVFEEHKGYPSGTSDLLESYGYKVFALNRRLTGLDLRSPDQLLLSQLEHEQPTYVATIDPVRAMRILNRPGWSIYKRGVPSKSSGD